MSPAWRQKVIESQTILEVGARFTDGEAEAQTETLNNLSWVTQLQSKAEPQSGLPQSLPASPKTLLVPKD